ncbi:MAG: TonB-dependent receptor plug domain-containing protein, partial [Porticoccaceae bacterium]|nr:TonB-dependent receptor plug domain-containing protein [Porticoccaceae bacterium]
MLNTKKTSAIHRRGNQMSGSNLVRKTALAVAISNVIVASMAHAAQIEEIVVTATKREASMQDIPMSVSAISGENLASMGIENIQDIEKAIPGMKIRDVGNHPKLIIRGAGSAGTTDVAVPIYNDGLYRPTASQGLASFVDVERIEVLRGPQGTLFGRNTLGGLLNVITKKPSTEGLDTGLSVSIGDYDLRKFQGFVNVPLSDSVAVRLTATDTTHDPYVENTFDSN